MQDVGIWSIIPPVVAILLAVLTKEVIFSLMCGILAGAAIYVLSCQLPLVEIISTTVNVMGSKLSDNINMILFLSLLGGLVAVITKAGGSNAYAAWAQKTFKSRRAALSATAVFSAFLFLDDYFNCITSGTVMRPVTDKFGLSREKLSYVVDRMAADLGVAVKELVGNADLCSKIEPSRYVGGEFGLPTINDIISELRKPGRDPRESAQEFEFDHDIHVIDDLKEGMELPGIVTNITAFGAFVDIGIKQNGLIHASQMGVKGMADPSKILKLHQQVKVRVISVDLDRSRIGLRLL